MISLNHHNKGFTLIEALVAITILILGVTGALTAASQGIASATYTKEDVIAFNLAQEGVEMIRNMRDGNGISGANWLTGIANAGDPCELGTSSCTVDVNAPVGSPFLVGCPDFGACPVLKEDPATGAFGYNPAWPDSPYTREIIISRGVGNQLVVGREVSIKVIITWMHGDASRSFAVQENILNWQS